MSDAEKATKRQPVLPMADWIETQPNLKTVYGRSVREPGGQVDVNGPVSPQDPTMTVSPRQVQDPGPATGQLKTDPAAIARAKDAITRGADRKAVEQRLRQSGIDPTGL